MYRDNCTFPRHLNETERHRILLKGECVSLECKKDEEHWFRSQRSGWSGVIPASHSS